MATHQAAENQWHTQLGTWLGVVALALALYALLRDNPNTRTGPDTSATELAAEIQLRDTIVKLQENMSPDSDSGGTKGSTARAWIYFQSAQELIEQKKAEPSLSGCLVLANFCFAHADVSQGNQYMDKAISKIKTESSPVTQCLAYAAIGHFLFDHTPKTKLEDGRERYSMAVGEADKIESEDSSFVQLSILQEWALDEYAAGNVELGDQQLAAAKKLLEKDTFTPGYRSSWDQNMETAVIQAKVRGGLL